MDSKRRRGALVTGIKKKLSARKHDLIFILIVVFVFGLAYRNLIRWQMVSLGNLVPIIPGFRSAWDANFYAWSEVNLGAFNIASPFSAIQTLLISILGGAYTQQFFMLFPMPLAAISMYILLKRLVNSRLSQIFVSLIYGLNSVTIYWFLKGSVDMLIPHSLFPLFLLTLYDLVECKTQYAYNTLKFSLCTGLLVSLQWQSSIFIAPFFIVIVLSRLSAEGRQLLLKKSGYVALSIVIVLLLSLPNYGILLLTYFVPRFSSIITRPVTEENLQFFLGNLGYYSYSPMSLINLRVFTFVLALFAFGALFVHRKKFYYLQFILVLALTLLFWQLTAMERTLGLFVTMPFLFVFQDVDKLIMMAIWSVFILTALVLNELSGRGFFKLENQ